MAIVNLDDPTDPVVAGFDVPQDCYLCQKPLAGWSVFWHALDQPSIALHPACAPRFAEHLVADALEAARMEPER